MNTVGTRPLAGCANATGTFASRALGMARTAFAGLVLAGVAAASPALAQGNSEAMNKLIEAAKKEGRLVIYSSESAAQVDASAADFQKRYGIKVEATRLVTGTLTSRYAAEAQSGRVVADVISISNTPFFTDNPDWWVKLDEKEVPGLDAYPKRAVGPNYITVSQQGIVIAYNTTMISKENAPKGYKDLLDKRFAAPGTIVIADPRATQSGMSFFWSMVENLGPDYYQNLMKQNPAIGPGAGPVAQLVGSGAHAIGIGTFSNHVQGVQGTGAPIAYIYPTEVATGSDNQIAISSKAPNPNAARLFAAYRMSRAAHDALCAVGGSASPLGEIKGCEPPAPANYIETNYKIWTDKAWQEKNLPLLNLKPRT